jgi:DNA (cytosine-5)-methyltransferase 1
LTWNDPTPNDHVITLREAIGDLPSLEAGEDSGIKNHWARLHPRQQIDWLRHTPEGCSAVYNTEHYPQKENGERIKSYANCYKRMVWDAPSPTVTMRNEIMSSQDKVHPGRDLGNGLWSDARVLTLRELLIVMSMPPDLDLPTFVSDTALRQYIGEGIPSLMVKKIMQGICLRKD